jgi:hypothetical protein
MDSGLLKHPQLVESGVCNLLELKALLSSKYIFQVQLKNTWFKFFVMKIANISVLNYSPTVSGWLNVIELNDWISHLHTRRYNII